MIECDPPKPEEGIAESVASIQGLYVHIPFCVHKCPYCDFASGPAEGARRRDYLEALAREIEMSPWAGARPSTLYFGGGTPSELTVPEWDSLFASLSLHFDLSQLEEFTVECNPGTLNTRKLQALNESGVNRISLGVQSFQDHLLERLGRIHDGASALESFAQARQAGFSNISLDLMFGLPGQTDKAWQQDLETAISLSPEHLSLYALAVEPGTPFFEMESAGQLHALSSDQAADMFEYYMDYCSINGYEQYEICSFSRKDLSSRHNLLYWTNRNYLGLGVSAASHLSGQRWANARDQNRYVRGWKRGKRVLEYRERLSRSRRATEEIILHLRLNEGADLDAIGARYELPLSETYRDRVNLLEQRKLLERCGDRIVLTRSGRLLASEVACEFLD